MLNLAAPSLLDYIENKEFQHWVKSIFALALTPFDSVEKK